MLLSDRVAIITGGAKGIGRATALKFADEGCSVIIADILEDRGKQTANEVSQKGVKGLAIKCDVTDSQQVHDMVGQVMEKFGKIDILVNDAGAMFGTVPAENETEDHWEKVLNLNLKGDYLCIKEVIPHMKARKYGKIVNLSSIGAVYPPGPSMAYASAKAGVLGMTRALAMELGPFNITVNAIMPGAIPTDFWNLPPNVDIEAMAANIGRGLPLQRVGTPEDIARVALFFASELSDFVTGEKLIVGGGEPLKPPMPPMPPKK